MTLFLERGCQREGEVEAVVTRKLRGREQRFRPPCLHGQAHAGLMNSRPFLAAAAIMRFTTSSVMGGGAALRSVVRVNASSKNCCMPVGPAGEMMTSALAGFVPSFFIEWTTPRGMWMKSPGLAWIVLPSAWKVAVPSSRKKDSASWW